MAVHYTPSTMDDTVICRVFNYHSYPLVPRLWLKFSRRLSNQRDHYTLGDVYRMFADGKKVQNILDENPDISMRATLIGRTFYMIHNTEQNKSHPGHRLKSMIDENIDIEHSVEAGIQTLGPTSHVAFEGLMGAKDARLWGRLRAGNYRLLVTKDSAVKPSRNTRDTLDITRCAILAWQRALKLSGGIVDENIRSLPVIVHVPHDASPSQIKNMLRKHKRQILNIFDEKVSPVIKVTKGKAKPGVHFFEIMDGGFKNQVNELRDLRVKVLENTFEIKRVQPLRRKEIIASLKRAVEHEISSELEPLGEHNNKVVYLHRAVKLFNPTTYSYSGDNYAYKREVSSAERGDIFSVPLTDRLESYKLNKSLQRNVPQKVFMP